MKNYGNFPEKLIGNFPEKCEIFYNFPYSQH